MNILDWPRALKLYNNNKNPQKYNLQPNNCAHGVGEDEVAHSIVIIQKANPGFGDTREQ